MIEFKYYFIFVICYLFSKILLVLVMLFKELVNYIVTYKPKPKNAKKVQEEIRRKAAKENKAAMRVIRKRGVQYHIGNGIEKKVVETHVLLEDKLEPNDQVLK